MEDFSRWLLFFFLGALMTLGAWGKNASASTGLSSSEQARPNIVFLLADDLRWDALGCMGNRIVRTPCLDALAQRGVLFESHFCATSICPVSRASIFLGQYERCHRIFDFAISFSPKVWSNAYPVLLRKHGYRTGFIGKFGVGEFLPAGDFDYWDGFGGQGRYFEPGVPDHLTERQARSAIRFLRSSVGKEPFCLSVSFKAPHAQDGARREFPPDPRDETLYQDVEIPPPSTGDPDHFRRLPHCVQDSEGRFLWEGRFSDPDQYQKTVRDYYRLVTGLDRAVGEIWRAVEELGLGNRTILVFSSDNGLLLGEHGLAGKWLMYEPSIRVPLLVYDPRLPPGLRGRRIAAMTLNVDLAPTFLDWAGTDIPGEIQGKSLRPLIEGKRVPWRTEWFYENHYTAGGRIPEVEGIRTEQWKYIRYPQTPEKEEELYCVARDPNEEKNLARDPSFRRILRRLQRQVQWWKQKLSCEEPAGSTQNTKQSPSRALGEGNELVTAP
ncbi:sulfatase family protein [Candidatus Methylacidithermus pantelleriae]|uniref:Arylsulfatase n=1 Tax=Candidatus Methylacidithermus pantelleriae TaxID=2744239 RepID=A0A8J2BQ67_9BACT|nr:sulfatase [Candidatus Methylacidithermus pantelleriae]CAF0698534.1 Arylsulfatase [Candidatus Methylacidithermus pantelleriae]